MHLPGPERRQGEPSTPFEVGANGPTTDAAATASPTTTELGSLTTGSVRSTSSSHPPKPEESNSNGQAMNNAPVSQAQDNLHDLVEPSTQCGNGSNTKALDNRRRNCRCTWSPVTILPHPACTSKAQESEIRTNTLPQERVEEMGTQII